jgi:hypothetical protein
MLHPDSEINELTKLLNKFSANNFSLIHCGYTDGRTVADIIKEYKNIKNNIFIDGLTGKLYQKHFKSAGIPKILIRDGFNTQKKNADYPKSEHFSDLHITYKDEEMDGFGDYLIVGDDYSETGGPAYAVAIHLTYLDKNKDNDMFIYHFISDRTQLAADPGGKFLEALEKLVRAINNPESLIFKSKACNEFLDLYNNKHYPGLGHVKKLSMQHHIELIANFLKNGI